MITREQMQELKELGKQIKYKVVKNGVRIRAEGKCSTLSASCDEEGYLAIKKRLEEIISESQKETQDAS